MNNEFVQMIAEIDRIAGSTEFNSINLLNTSAASNSATIHFGSQETIIVDSVDVRSLSLGVNASAASIATAANAQSALALVSVAIERKDSARAMFGYMMNRLESTNEVLNIQSENLMAAESRISDVDVATEMAALTRNQVLAQAGIAMLAQANTMPQMALTLLRG
jgi:flagellin